MNYEDSYRADKAALDNSIFSSITRTMAEHDFIGVQFTHLEDDPDVPLAIREKFREAPGGSWRPDWSLNKIFQLLIDARELGRRLEREERDE